jgi:PAS domain S-box-containing protein
MVGSSDILNAKILIVDDQEANVRLLERMLRGAGYASIQSTMDPYEVCGLHRKNHYALILLDLQMPGMDGFQVMESLKEIETDGYLPVLALTARPDHKLRALKTGAKDFVSKPLDLSEVLMRVYNMLEVRLLHLETKNLYDQVVAEQKVTKQSEAALRVSEERFRALFELGPTAVYSCDTSGTIREFNLCAAELWGREPALGDTDERFCGSFKLFRPDGSFMPHDLCSMAKVLSGKIPEVCDQEVLIERPDGSRVNVVVNIVPLKNQRGEITGAINCFYDITARKQSEAALIKSEKLAAAGRLAAVLAHEINNPLQAVTNLLDLLKRSPGLDDQAQGFAALAEKELGRVVHLVRQSLGFFQESTAPAAINVAEVLDSVLVLYARQLEARQITVSKQYRLGKTIESYSGEIRQMFSTLLVNAMDAMAEGGAIVVRADHRSEWKNPSIHGVRITVADNGVGIPPDAQLHMFEPFFTTKGEHGTGLGLWVTQGIANRLGGSIRVRSKTQPGNSGTCFSFFLPSHTEKPAGLKTLTARAG